MLWLEYSAKRKFSSVNPTIQNMLIPENYYPRIWYYRIDNLSWFGKKETDMNLSKNMILFFDRVKLVLEIKIGRLCSINDGFLRRYKQVPQGYREVWFLLCPTGVQITATSFRWIWKILSFRQTGQLSHLKYKLHFEVIFCRIA